MRERAIETEVKKRRPLAPCVVTHFISLERWYFRISQEITQVDHDLPIC